MLHFVVGVVLGLLGGRVFWWLGALVGAGLGLAFSVVADEIADRFVSISVRWWCDKTGMTMFGIVGAGVGYLGVAFGLGLLVGPLCAAIAGLVSVT